MIASGLTYTHAFFANLRDELQNREHCWNAASLCDKNEIGEQQPRQDNSSNRSGRGNAIGILRRVRRCLSTGAIPIPASMTIARSSSTLPPKTTTEPTFYQSYSCDDLYLVSDLTPGKFNSSEPITEQEHEFAVADERQQPDGEASGLVFHDISLGNPIDVVCRYPSFTIRNPLVCSIMHRCGVPCARI